jgi:predicted ArsR family transcriptional regulator
VDWHLLKLTAFGVVERSAVSSATSRPRITYKLTATGRELIDLLDSTVDRHFRDIGKKFEALQHELDILLSHGEISEEVYKERTKRLKREMDFLKGES